MLARLLCQHNSSRDAQRYVRDAISHKGSSKPNLRHATWALDRSVMRGMCSTETHASRLRPWRNLHWHLLPLRLTMIGVRNLPRHWTDVKTLHASRSGGVPTVALASIIGLRQHETWASRVRWRWSCRQAKSSRGACMLGQKNACMHCFCLVRLLQAATRRNP